MILAEPIIGLIYQHGRFTTASTIQTAGALRFYAIGLVGYSAVKVLAPAFYALDKRNLPMFVSLFSIGLNAALNWFFTFRLELGHRGLALSTSLVALTNFLLLYIMMRRYIGRLETGVMLRTLAKLFVAGALLAGICFAAQYFHLVSTEWALWRKALGLVVTIAVGGAIFFGSAYFLRVAEVRDVVELVRGKVSRLRA
jgi:putative peptidoglycan lipid II flippase